jgi:hypothetical protein
MIAVKLRRRMLLKMFHNAAEICGWGSSSSHSSAG